MAQDKSLTAKERSQQLALERRAARLAAVQALYQWEQTGGKPEAIISEFGTHRINRKAGEESELPPADRKLFAELVRGVAASVGELDDMLSAVISDEWSVERLESILRAIMRCGAFELAHRQDVPPKVVISEYLAVADAFFGEKETGMTNGILDKLAQTLRPGELAGKGSGRGGQTAR
ncbi:transcription antitermination factor NusB [Dongia sp.]|uniref:transcription antitermination factor NusB n=1 Tax=Dongia sp. TaxID=1977262 RepID=UPI0035B4A3EA